MDEVSYSGTSRFRRKLSKRIILFAAFFAIIAFLIGGVIFFVTRGSSSPEPQNSEEKIKISNPPTLTLTPTPTEEVTKTPTKQPTKTPTKAPAKESSDSKLGGIAVQNGGGVAGAGASAAAVLRGAGYEIASTANADNFDYTGVTIKIKSSKKSFLAELQKALEGDYTISDTSTDLSEGQSFDALVIIGK